MAEPAERPAARTRNLRPLIAGVMVVAAATLVLGALVVTRGGGDGDSVAVVDEPNTWSALPSPPLGRRAGAATVGTPLGVFVWGGVAEQPGRPQDGAFWSVDTRAWRVLPPAPFDGSLTDPFDVVPIWDGTEVVLYREARRLPMVQAVAFDPAAWSWRVVTELEEGAGPPLRPIGDVIAGRGFFAPPAGRTDSRVYHRAGVGAPAVEIDFQWGGFFGGRAATTDHLAVLTDRFGDLAAGEPTGTNLQVYSIATGETTAYRLPVDGWALGRACGDDVERDPERFIFESYRLRPPILTSLGNRFLIAGGRAGCSAASETTRAAVVVDPVAGTVTRVADVPVDTEADVRLASSKGSRIGPVFMTIDHRGRPLAYHAELDRWHVGPSLFEALGVAGTASADGLDLIDLAVIDGTLVVTGGRRTAEGIPVDESAPWLCCKSGSSETAWAYRPTFD